MRTFASTLLTLALSLAACGGSFTVSLSSSGDMAESDGFGVTGGGSHVVPGEPVTFFGTCSDRDTRRYTYLVIARDLMPATGSSAHTINGRCSADGRALVAEHTLEVQGVRIAAMFSARVGDDGLEGEVTTLNGQRVPAGQWLFLLDGKNPDAGFVPVDSSQPTMPMELEKLEPFTEKFVQALAANSTAVKAFLAGS